MELLHSPKNVMFSSSFHLFVCLFVGRITQNYSIDFHKIRWKGGTRDTEEPIRFFFHFSGNPDNVTLGLRLGKGYSCGRREHRHSSAFVYW